MKCHRLISSIRTTIQLCSSMIYIDCLSSFSPSAYGFARAAEPQHNRQRKPPNERKSNARAKWSNLSFCIWLHLFLLCRCICVFCFYFVHSILLTAAMLHSIFRHLSSCLLCNHSHSQYMPFSLRCVVLISLFIFVPAAVLSEYSRKMQFHLRA